jgi:hypothetical protein
MRSSQCLPILILVVGLAAIIEVQARGPKSSQRLQKPLTNSAGLSSKRLRSSTN